MELNKFLCFIGFHKWEYGTIKSYCKQNPKIKPIFQTRMCLYCNKYQYLTQLPNFIENRWYDLQPNQKMINIEYL